MLAVTGSTTFPFCSERCRSIDLGRWLGERYRVEVSSSSDDLVSVADEDSPSGEHGDTP
jgi:endogenous inhibitor of DNA gyrase (YacG/DUF329 family)